jgi:predicted Zn-dependent peptidase
MSVICHAQSVSARTISRHVTVMATGFLLLCSFALVTPVSASEYSPPGIYDVEHVVLKNDMRVILKPRTGTRSVSLRLAVDIGVRDFPCSKRETPHFLEHLMFAGTTKHDEAELDELIVTNGGSWNAMAGSDETVYEIDIFSEYADLGLEVLHEIITSSVIAPSDVDDVRDIIHREMGGKPSQLRQWLYLRGIGQSGAAKAMQHLYPGGEFICPDLETAEGISREGILKARDDFYVPNNMTLVAVGEFEPSQMLDRIQATFGQLAPKPVPKARVKIPEIPDQRTTTKGTLEPLVDSEAAVGFVFRVSGVESPNYYAFLVLEEYLDTRLYEAVRIEAALAYAPEVIHAAALKRGILAATTDVEIDSMDEALAIIQREIRRLSEAPLDAEVVETTKRGILLGSVWAFESNADFADYYVAFRHEIETRGAFIDEEAEIERVAANDVFRVAKQYLRDDRGIVNFSSPTLTYVQLYVGIGAVILVAALGVGGYSWRRNRQGAP